MQNPEDNNHFPWKWVIAGCSAVVVVALVLIAAVVIVALPAIQKRVTVQSPLVSPLLTPNTGPTAKPFPTPFIGQTVPPLPTSPAGQTVPPLPSLPAGTAAAPTPGTANGTTIGNLPFTFSAVQDPTTLPTQSLMDQMTTALNLNSASDYMAPKAYTGTAALDPSSSFTVGNAWCAKDPTTLQQNLSKMQFLLSIDGTSIDLSQYPTLNFTDPSGDACAITGVSITPGATLSSSYHIVLTQKYLASLDDGITGSPYPAGEVTFDFTVQFQGVPKPGQKS